MRAKDILQLGATVTLSALFFLCLAWELKLAPLRPGGSFLAVKALPLLFALPGIWRGRRYTYQWASLAIFAWLVEGVTRGMSEHGASQVLALFEAVLSAAFFACAVGYARLTRPAR